MPVTGCQNGGGLGSDQVTLQFVQPSRESLLIRQLLPQAQHFVIRSSNRPLGFLQPPVKQRQPFIAEGDRHLRLVQFLALQARLVARGVNLVLGGSQQVKVLGLQLFHLPHQHVALQKPARSQADQQDRDGRPNKVKLGIISQTMISSRP